jgi:SAM-dependent methyltransferase
MTPDQHYLDPRMARLYDLDCDGRADTEFYLSLAGPDPRRILDLGCGTGILANAYAARGHVVTGVDPAPAMLDMARGKPQGRGVTWTQATAQSFRSPHRFDLIVMTGHAFQVLLDDADIAATLTAMRQHLAPGGMIAFDTRNPRINWVARAGGYVYPRWPDDPAGPSRPERGRRPHHLRHALCVSRRHPHLHIHPALCSPGCHRAPCPGPGPAGAIRLRRLDPGTLQPRNIRRDDLHPHRPVSYWACLDGWFERMAVIRPPSSLPGIKREARRAAPARSLGQVLLQRLA